MRFLILSDLFSLDSWLIEGAHPKIMPAVYNFFQYLGQSEKHTFTAIIFHPSVSKTIAFPNGSQIEIHQLRVPFHYPRKLASIFQMRKYAIQKLQLEKYDLVYGMTIYSIVARWVGKKIGILSVSRLFGSLLFEIMRKHQYFKLYTRHILQYLEAKSPTDLIICTEDGTQFDEALAQINPKYSVHLLLNGIDDHLRKKLLAIPIRNFNANRQAIRLLSMGRLTYWKRHDLAIELLYYLKTRHHLDNITLTILGEGKERKKLQKLITKKGLESLVIIEDPVAHDIVPHILADHDVFLSLYDASNLSNSIWEAALSGILICTRPTGKTALYFRDGQNCIIKENIEEIAESLMKFIMEDSVPIMEKARSDIHELIPSWEQRFEEELQIIEQHLPPRNAVEP